MAVLQYQRASVGGTTVAMANATVGGDQIAPQEGGILMVRNIGAAASDVTIVVPGTKFGQPLGDVTKEIAVGATEIFDVSNDELADPADNLVDITYETAADIRVAAILA